jgi:hypothetical protein
MDRRDFLKTTAMTAAAAAAARLAFDGGPGVTWDKAPCRFCGTGCHVQVGVKDGKVVAIAGDRQAEVNKGLLCVKGYHVGLILYGGDRLTTPLLRKDGRLVPISWDEAIDIDRRPRPGRTRRSSPSTAAASGPSRKGTPPTSSSRAASRTTRSTPTRGCAWRPR